MSSPADLTFRENLKELEDIFASRRFNRFYTPNAPLPSPADTHIITYFIQCTHGLAGRIARDPRCAHPLYRARVKHALREADKYVRFHKALVSVLRRVPEGVIRRVFEFVVGGCGSGDEQTQSQSQSQSQEECEMRIIQRSRAGRTLSQVCYAWRSIAFSTPELWQALPPITLDAHKRHSTTKEYRRFLATQLLLSRGLPISFVLRGRSFASVSHSITALLVQHAKRWAYVVLRLPLKGLLALAGARGHLAALEGLCLDWAGCRERDCIGTYDLFADAPRLREVRLRKGLSGSVVVPYRTLEVLEVRKGVVDVDKVLRGSARLRMLDLTDVTAEKDGAETEDGDKLVHTEMADLTSLRIHRGDYTTVQRLVKNLTAPKLTELELSCSTPGSSRYTLPLTLKLLARSRPDTSSCLTRLFLRCRLDRPGAFTELMRAAPLLTHLNVSAPCPMDIIQLGASSARDGGAWLLAPKLEVCTFAVGAREVQEVSDGLVMTLNFLARLRCEVRDVFRYVDEGGERDRKSAFVFEKKPEDDRRKALRALYVSPHGAVAQPLRERFQAAYDELHADERAFGEVVDGGSGKAMDEEWETIRERYRVEPGTRKMPWEKLDAMRCKIVYLPRTNVIRQALESEPGFTQWMLKTSRQFVNDGSLTLLNVCVEDRLWPPCL